MFSKPIPQTLKPGNLTSKISRCAVCLRRQIDSSVQQRFNPYYPPPPPSEINRYPYRNPYSVPASQYPSQRSQYGYKQLENNRQRLRQHGHQRRRRPHTNQI